MFEALPPLPTFTLFNALAARLPNLLFFPLAEVDDVHADGTLTMLFIVALVAAVLFYHTPRRIARLADYFAALGLPIGYQGYFRWWQEGKYRGVPLKIECSSQVRGSGPFALVATLQFTEDLHVDTLPLLPAGTTVFAHGPGHLCFRLPEELHEKQSAWEPIALLDRLIDLDPNADDSRTEPPAQDAYTFRPWKPLPLLISLVGGFSTAWCGWHSSFLAAALVLAGTVLVSVILSNLRSRPATLASTRAWAWQLAIALALCILGVGLVFTRYGWLAARDFEKQTVGPLVVIPHQGVTLQLYRQLERGLGQIGRGGEVLGNSLSWELHDKNGALIEDGKLTLKLSEFDWIAPIWDDGQKMFILGIIKEYGGYQALTIQPLPGDTPGAPSAPPPADSPPVVGPVLPPANPLSPTPPPPPPPPVEPDYKHWLVCRPLVPPNTPLARKLNERIKLETQKSQAPAHD